MNRILTLFVLLITVFTIGGVYATWQYANIGPNPGKCDISIKLGEFNWAGSGDLPTDSEIGEDHISLVQNIIDHAEHGLNKSDSYLNEQIEKRQKGGIGWRDGRDTLGSMAVDQSDELKDIFGLDANNLTFLIHIISDNEYHIYTTNVYLGERGEINWLGNNKTPGKPTVPIGQPIYVIYKTKVVKTNGEWVAVETKVGYANSAWYEESRSNANATQIPSFDPNTFKEGKPQ